VVEMMNAGGPEDFDQRRAAAIGAGESRRIALITLARCRQ
jgi:hypothetical protein